MPSGAAVYPRRQTGRVRTAVLLILASCAVGPATASAQVPPGATFGGGAIALPGKTVGQSGDREVALRVAADGLSARIRALSVLRCRGRLDAPGAMGTVGIGPDGHFAGRLRRRVGRGVGRETYRIDIAGTIAGSNATGTMTASVLRRGRRRCSHTGTWRALVPPEFPSEGDDTAPTWAGVVDQPGATAPLGVMLRTGIGREDLTRVLIGLRIRCRRASPFYLTHFTGTVPDQIGEFEIRDRFGYRDARVRHRVSAVVTGFAVSVGFTGTARYRSVHRSRRTGRVIDRCDSGRVTYKAAPG